MKSKILLRHYETGELKATSAKIDGSVFKKYILDGFEPIGMVGGIDLLLVGLNLEWGDHNAIFQKYAEITNESPKVKKTFKVEIEVDADKVAQLYPNYRLNYSNPLDLIYTVAKDIQNIAGVDMAKDGMKMWGYSVKVKPI